MKTKSTLLLALLSLSLFSTNASAKAKLAHLFGANPSARFQSVSEGDKLTVNYGNIAAHKFDLKFNLFAHKGAFYTFTRIIHGDTSKRKGIVLLKGRNRDGLVFDKQGGYLFNNLYNNGNSGWEFYDPHVSVSRVNGVLTYTMVMECAKFGNPGAFGASVCISKSINPTSLSSWTRPTLLVKNGTGKSASTGVSFTDRDGKTYISWTMVNDGRNASREEGNESTSSLIERFYNDPTTGTPIFLGASDKIGKYILRSKTNTKCTSTWDCNNQDIHDIKREDNYIYATYNGGNFFRCHRGSYSAGLSNKWDLSIRRSTSPLGSYNDSAGILIENINDTKCGISYPTLNVINGVTYMYYSYYDRKGSAKFGRSKLLEQTPRIVRTASTQTNVNTSNDRCRERIQSVYSYWLKKFPTNSETNYWTKRAKRTSLKRAISGILLSNEGTNKAVRRSSQDNITRLYRSILLRGADAAGMRRYAPLLNRERNRINQGFINLFINSNEFNSKARGIRCS